MHRRLAKEGVIMDEVLIRPDENAAVHMHRELGPFGHLLWLVDQWTPRHFLFVSRIEGSSISVENAGHYRGPVRVHHCQYAA
jgi:hypothetical protein